MSVLVSIAGIIILLLIAYFCSNNRKAIQFRLVIGAFLLQIGFAVCMLYWSAGKEVMLWISGKLGALLDYTKQGTSFLLGGLVSMDSYGFIFVFHVLPVLVFLSALSALLFHFGIMQILIRAIGGALQKVLGTSKAESMSAAANIFLGVTEAPLVIKPYIKHLSRSEYFTVLVGGVASIAGTVLLGYSQFGVKIEYLLAASFMSAPAGLLFAKLFFPETEENSDKYTAKNNSFFAKSEYRNAIDAIAQGARTGVSLALNVSGMLLALLALIAMLNGIIIWFTGFFGLAVSLTDIFAWFFSPVAYLIGVGWGEAALAGEILGQKIIFNEFIAYGELKPYLEGKVVEQTQVVMSEKTQVILSFALCGFTNIGTIGVAIGGIGGMCPERRSELTSIAFKALFAAILANLMNGAIAGIILG